MKYNEDLAIMSQKDRDPVVRFHRDVGAINAELNRQLAADAAEAMEEAKAKQRELPEYQEFITRLLTKTTEAIDAYNSGDSSYHATVTPVEMPEMVAATSGIGKVLRLKHKPTIADEFHHRLHNGIVSVEMGPDVVEASDSNFHVAFTFLSLPIKQYQYYDPRVDAEVKGGFSYADEAKLEVQAFMAEQGFPRFEVGPEANQPVESWRRADLLFSLSAEISE